MRLFCWVFVDAIFGFCPWVAGGRQMPPPLEYLAKMWETWRPAKAKPCRLATLGPLVPVSPSMCISINLYVQKRFGGQCDPTTKILWHCFKNNQVLFGGAVLVSLAEPTSKSVPERFVPSCVHLNATWYQYLRGFMGKSLDPLSLLLFCLFS